MYISNVNKIKNIKECYLYKLKRGLGIFYIMMGIHIVIGTLITFNYTGVSSSFDFGGDFNNINMNISFYNPYLGLCIGTMFIIFTFVISLVFSDDDKIDFTFGVTRRTTTIANILYLITLAIFSNVSAILMDGASKLVNYLRFSSDNTRNFIQIENLSLSDMISTFTISFCISLIIISLMYLIVILYKGYKINFIIGSILLCAAIIFMCNSIDSIYYTDMVIKWFKETSYIMICVLSLIGSSGLFYLSYFVNSKSEVKL